MISIREAVRTRAGIAGISLNEVERRGGWRPGDMYGLLRTSLSLKSLHRIATALGVPAWMLLRDVATNEEIDKAKLPSPVSAPQPKEK